MRQCVRIVGIFGVAKEYATIPVPFQQALIHRTHPQSPVSSFKKAVHTHDTLEAYFVSVKGIIREAASRHVEGAQTVSELRAYPDDTRLVLRYGTYVIETEAMGIVRIVKETRKTAGCPI